MIRPVAAAVGAAIVLASAARVEAQVPPQTPAATTPRVALELGGVGLGGRTLGTTTVVYTAPDGTAVPQYSIDRAETVGAGLAARLRFRVRSRLELEVEGRWTRPSLTAHLSGDTDGAADTTASNRVHQFMVGAGLRLNAATRAHWQPFVRGSAGWLGQLSEDISTIGQGWFLEGGGGVEYRFHSGTGLFRPYAVRGDIGVNLRSGGLRFSDTDRVVAPVVGVSLVLSLSRRAAAPVPPRAPAPTPRVGFRLK